MSYTMDTAKLKSGMEKYEHDLKKEISTILKKSTVAYAERASRYVPPRINGKWSKSIPAKLYKRGVQYMPEAIKTEKSTVIRKLYGQKMKEKYLYVVTGRLRGKVHRWFATTLRNAAKYTRIHNRGLFKALFGANLGAIGESVPAFFQKLLSKSPNLLKHKDRNRISMKNANDEQSIRISNEAWDNEKFARESIYQGEKAAKQTMRKMWKEWESKRREV